MDSYATVINRETEIIGVSGYLRSELVTLMELAGRGLLDFENVITDNLPLDALAGFHGHTRSVIIMP